MGLGKTLKKIGKKAVSAGKAAAVGATGAGWMGAAADYASGNKAGNELVKGNFKGVIPGLMKGFSEGIYGKPPPVPTATGYGGESPETQAKFREDMGVYKNPYMEQQMASIGDERNRIAGITSPEMRAAQIANLPEFERTQIGALGPYERTEIGPLQQMQAAKGYQVQGIGDLGSPEAARIAAMQGLSGPQISQANIGRESLLAGQLEQTLAGKTPSVAEMQMQRGLEQQRAAQASALATARGGATAANMRTAALQMARGQQEATSAAGLLRAQEQAQARGQYGQLVTSGRSQDLQAAQMGQEAKRFTSEQANIAAREQAGFQQQANLAGFDAKKAAALQTQNLQTQAGMQEAGFGQQANLTNYEGERARTMRQADLDASRAGTMYSTEANRTMKQGELDYNRQAALFGAGAQRNLAQAGFEQEAGRNNQQAQMQVQQLRESLLQQYLAAGMNVQQAQWQANMDAERQRAYIERSMYQFDKGLEAGNYANQRQAYNDQVGRTQDLFSTGAQVFGTMYGGPKGGAAARTAAGMVEPETYDTTPSAGNNWA